ncbi:uncharacterized protein LOC122624288 [Drosophila teissieri]|uniref:uncharacterized protein LOC122624288 n=1 Tax=Drosophila teissieri TaxID=7243 RepID=UPI001CBA3609|nr:uncharacterized protein LOC122624288 [Drosophila teissieri]
MGNLPLRHHKVSHFGQRRLMSLNHGPKMAYYMGAPKEVMGAAGWGDGGMAGCRHVHGHGHHKHKSIVNHSTGEGLQTAGRTRIGDGSDAGYGNGNGNGDGMQIHIPAERNLRCTFQFPAKDFITTTLDGRATLSKSSRCCVPFARDPGRRTQDTGHRTWDPGRRRQDDGRWVMGEGPAHVTVTSVKMIVDSRHPKITRITAACRYRCNR